MRQAVEVDDPGAAGEGLVGRARQQSGPGPDEHVALRGGRPRGDPPPDVVEQTRRQVNVVDQDRGEMAGEEGCRVLLGAGRFTGEREGDTTMSWMEDLREMGFAGGSGTCDDEWAWRLVWRDIE
jgi:hypothetical protein